MNVDAADVIIVGGGIMGAASAFFLRKRGVSVILLERGLVGQQASGVNFGNVRRQGRYLDQMPLANRSRAIWGKLKALIGDDAEFLLSGHLRVGYRPEHVENMERHALETRPFGLGLQMLGAQAVHKRFPFLGPDVIAGSYAPHDGHANPRLAAPAFGRAAVREGAHVHENTDIVQVEKDGEDFRVSAADGRVFRAPTVLVTAGAWANRISTAFGEPVPIVARGPQMAVTEPVPYGLAPVMGVATDLMSEGIYFRQVARGNIVLGGCAREQVDLDQRRACVRPHNTLLQFTQLQRVVPALKNLSILRVWSGIESYTQDDRPVIGPSARVPGLYYAFGFNGEGFQLGPGVGDVMAELIHTGATSTPVGHYHIGRFSRLAKNAA